MCMFFFLPPALSDDNATQANGRRLTKWGVAMVFALLLAAGLLVFLLRSPVSATLPVILTIVTAVMVGVIAVVFVRATETGKHKRDLAAGDMYSLIDRMLPELDENERLYLQRRLDEMGAGRQKESPEALSELLDERIRERRERA